MIQWVYILRFSNRQLTPKELDAWARRRRHPIRLAFLSISAVTTATLILCLGIYGLAYATGDKIRTDDLQEFMVLSGITGFVVGLVVFVWWFGTGVRLYHRQKPDDDPTA